MGFTQGTLAWTLAWLGPWLGLRVSSWGLPGATWGLSESFLTFEGACELVLETLLVILLKSPEASWEIP